MDRPTRRLGTGDAVVIGLGSMIGAGCSPRSRRQCRPPAPVCCPARGWLVPVVRTGAAAAALGSLVALVLGLVLGLARTTLAMARDRRLPGVLDAVHPVRRAAPVRARPWVSS